MTACEQHPDDVTARGEVRDLLRTVRLDAGMSERAVSVAAGFTNHVVRDMELLPSWSVWRVQAWARGLDHRLRMRIAGIDVPDGGDFESMLLASSTAFGGADEDLLHLQTVVNDLRLVRERDGVSLREMDRRLGVTPGCTHRWITFAGQVKVSTLQAHTRALGGVLALDVEPASVWAVAA